MTFGKGKHTYEVQEGWGQLPAGWSFGWIPAVAVDSHDRIYVYSRSEHPMVVFDREGNFLGSWGEDILKDAHGIFKVIAQWGSKRGSEVPGEFFACPHGIWTDSRGDLYVAEVQADRRLQKFIRQK